MFLGESTKTISTKPWYMKKEHLIHKFHYKGLGTDNKKINSITVHGTFNEVTIFVILLIMGFLFRLNFLFSIFLTLLLHTVNNH